MRAEYLLSLEVYHWLFNRAHHVPMDAVLKADVNSNHIFVSRGTQALLDFDPADWFGDISSLVYHLQQFYRNIGSRKCEVICTTALTHVNNTLREMANVNICDRTTTAPERYEEIASAFLFELYARLRVLDYIPRLSLDNGSVSSNILNMLYWGLNARNLKLVDDPEYRHLKTYFWKDTNERAEEWWECPRLHRILDKQIKYLDSTQRGEDTYHRFSLFGELAVYAGSTIATVKLGKSYDVSSVDSRKLIHAIVFFTLSPVNLIAQHKSQMHADAVDAT